MNHCSNCRPSNCSMNHNTCHSRTNGMTSSPCSTGQFQNPGRMMQNAAQAQSTQECLPSLSQMNQQQLLNYINEVSFVVSDMQLYLDTHPDDRQALDFCKNHIMMRKQALREYARLYGPLTIDTADDNASCSWKWVETPWPWERRCN